MTEREKMLSGEMYNSMDDELVQLRQQARLLTEKFNSTSVTQLSLRTEILRELFGSCGNSIYIEPSFNCDYGKNI